MEHKITANDVTIDDMGKVTIAVDDSAYEEELTGLLTRMIRDRTNIADALTRQDADIAVTQAILIKISTARAARKVIKVIKVIK